MLRDPPNSGETGKVRAKGKKSRFQIVKLEERIAPSHRKGHYPNGPNCHYNPNAGKYVGCGKPN
jgi:hypothetical protein